MTTDYQSKRKLKKIDLNTDLVIVGGGLAGTCAAITAARQGLQVVLVQDRPVLGGNSSSEVRLWVLGATSHMGNNNRWAREGGVVDEILVENMYRNKEGNPIIFDTILLEKVVEEQNITLLLNTVVYEASKKDDATIASLQAFCSQNSTAYQLSAPLFCDASGDGIVGFLAGAAFRMGAEKKEEFGEGFAPDTSYGELLGHTIYFYTKDTGKPVKFVAPSYALKDINQIPRFNNFNANDYGCRLWWLEYGGRMDTVHDTEAIKWELWKVVYGVWDYIKNSGKFPEAETLTLEWVGSIPGKRESRRFEGDYMLIQQDVIEQRYHDDIVAFGGWSVDLHPSDGVYSDKPGCNQWHSKGIYGIPYRCYYSKNIDNLYLAGRIVSASHVAFGSSRVMATCAHGAQAVAIAATICKKYGILPREVGTKHMTELQSKLFKYGQHLPQIKPQDTHNLAKKAKIQASSTLKIQQLAPSDTWIRLNFSTAQMLPLTPGQAPTMYLTVDADEDTVLQTALRISSKPFNHTPDVELGQKSIVLKKGRQQIALTYDAVVAHTQYAFYTLFENNRVSVQASEQRLTGVLTVFNQYNKAVSNKGKQTPPNGIGIDTFEFWTPQRRPAGQNFAFSLAEGLAAYDAENLKTAIARPVAQTNAWAAGLDATEATLSLNWDAPQTVQEIMLSFDPDYDHPMETTLMGHPEDVMPFCVRQFELYADGQLLHTCTENHQGFYTLHLTAAISVQILQLVLKQPNPNVPIALFRIWVK